MLNLCYFNMAHSGDRSTLIPMPLLCRGDGRWLEILCLRGLYARLREECCMFDLLFFGGGFALFCLLIAYERLCNRL